MSNLENTQAQMRKGVLEFCILSIIAQGEVYPSDIIAKMKDAKLVDSVLSDKYVYFTQSGHTFDRASLVKTAGSNVYTLQNMERESYTVMLEGNTAVVNTTWQGKGVYHGQNFDDKQRCSITIVKHEGKVKILSEHCTPIRNTPIVN